jgi:CDP-glucose 4,6-dehydratase
VRWQVTVGPQPHEATLLYLDSAKARTKLHWKPVWNFDVALERTAIWYRVWLEGGQVVSRDQLKDYINAAVQANMEWATG